MKNLTFKNNSYSLAELVANELEELIKDKKLSSGDKLPNEFELAELLNVGRGTIREAIKILSSKNVVEILRGKGTFVSEKPGISNDPLGLRFLETNKLKLAHDLLEVRMMIEPSIAALASLNANPEEIESLKKTRDKIEGQIKIKESHEEYDRQFHSIIASMSNNVVVPNLIPIIHKGVSLSIEVTENSLNNETIKTHREITKAIENKNPKDAEKWMTIHLEYNIDILNHLLDD